MGYESLPIYASNPKNMLKEGHVGRSNWVPPTRHLGRFFSNGSAFVHLRMGMRDHSLQLPSEESTYMSQEGNNLSLISLSHDEEEVAPPIVAPPLVDVVEPSILWL